MRKLIAFFLFLIHFSASNAQISQVIDVQFQFDEEVFVNNFVTGQTAERIGFENAIFNDESPYTPIYSKRFQVSNLGKLKIEVVDFKILSSSPIESIDKPEYVKNIENTLNNSIQIDYRIEENRRKYFAEIFLTPIINSATFGIQYIESVQLKITHYPQNTIVSRSPVKDNSVLREGEVYKLKIQKEGIYKLTGSYLQNELGLNISGIDPATIQIFSNPGGRVPLFLSDERIDDLNELAIKVSGTSDNSLDANDAIYFYAEGAESWKYQTDNNLLQYNDNPFDVDNYVFLRLGIEEGKRITTTGANVSDVNTIDYFLEAQRYELNSANLLKTNFQTIGSGQEWYGEYFDITKVIDFTSKFSISNIVENESANVKVRFAGRANSSSSLVLNIDGESFPRTFSQVDLDNYNVDYANIRTIDKEFTLKNNTPSISLDYSSNPSAIGWLDYIEVQYKKQLKFENKTLKFSNIDVSTENSFNFSIQDLSTNHEVWDITTPETHKQQKIESSNNSSYFTCPNEDVKVFIAFNPTESLLQPISGNKISNQNLHSIQNAEMLIVTTEALYAQAERLANHRNAHSGYEIRIVNIDQVYNEFSCGRREPTAIRDFFKMVYDRDENLKFGLLIGNGSYDYKGILLDRDQFNQIPVFESPRSLSAIYSFPSDDFFGLLSSQDGDDLKGEVDLAIGRIPVYSIDHASTVIDKIIKYDTDPSVRGAWNLTSIFAADDEDSNLHINPADVISESIISSVENINAEKIYFDSYPQVSTPGGERYPSVTDDITNNMFKGSLTFCYLGHGGPTGWAQERVLMLNDIDSWNNTRSYPLFITATCSLASYDDPEVFSAGEKILVNKNGGIGLFTTSRAVFSNENTRLTRAVHNFLLTEENGELLPLGEILRQAKNSSSSDTLDVNARKFLLLGDPSMRLLYPKYDVVTTTINDQDIINGTLTDTISALSKMSISGFVADGTNIIADYNGEITVTVFDKRTTRKTLVNDSGSKPKDFLVQKNIIFRGKAKVTNGVFDLEFTVPKDILFNIGKGKISYYATDGKRDAAGNYTNFLVGGSSKNPVQDDTPPVVEVFMNDENFVFGGLTDTEPVLYAKITDDIGINLSGASIGHDLTANLDEDSQKTYFLNDFFETELNDFSKGIVKYPLSKLENGKHAIKVRAWDIANNVGEGFTEFIVSDNSKDGLAHVLNYPNPFTDNTCFMFEHNLGPDIMDVQVNIYTISGKLVKTIDHNTVAEGYRINDIKWDGNDDFGSPLGKGVYLYKIKMRAESQNIQKESKFEKLVILK